MYCGFAPYQATLIASENINVAGYSNGLAFAKMLYKCIRPFCGEVWLPTANAQNTLLVNELAALNLPACGGSASYATFNRTDVTVPGITSFTQIQRLGFPDASLPMKPPFRLIAFDAQNTMWYPSASVLNPSFGAAQGGQIAQGVVGNPGYDLYNWLPANVVPAGYSPPMPTNNNTAISGNSHGHLPFAATVANALFSRTEVKGYSYPVPGPNIAGFAYANCADSYAYGNTFYNTGKISAMGDGVNYWGVLPLNENGGCSGIEVAINNGMVVFAPGNWCTCWQHEQIAEFGFVSDDDANEEQWVMYRWGPSSRTVQETPIQSIGVNFGAPGDRWDDLDGVLWTHHPWGSRNGSGPTEPYPMTPIIYRGTNVTNRYHYSGLFPPTNATHAWVCGSSVMGMNGLTIPLAQPLVAQRATTPPVMDGSLTDACWSNATPINLFTSSDTSTNGIRNYCMVCYDATNLYIAGVLHQSGPRPLNYGGGTGGRPVYLKVALGERGHASSVNQIVQLYSGDPQQLTSVNGSIAAQAMPGQQSLGIPTNAWTGAYATNKEMYAGEIAIPWSALASAGLWTSQLVMNVDVCGKILNGSGLDGWNFSSANLTTVPTPTGNTSNPDLPKYLSPLYLDAARGSVAQAIPHTVKLFFAETEGLTNGQRVFDVQLQGETVLTNFDVFSACGGKPFCEVVKEFRNIGIADKLNIDFVAHAGQPILGGVEIVTNGAPMPNQPPVAFIDASTLSGPAPLAVQFSAQRSHDPDGQIVECAWDTGDGRVARGSLLHHIFAEPGTYTVSLLVLDNSGATAAATNITVTVTPGVPAAFVCNIRSNKAPNCDYTTLSAWVTAMQGSSGGCDLLSTTTVFTVSAQSGTINKGWTVTFTGGATGILRALTSWVTNGVTNTVAEVAYVGGTGTVMTGTVTTEGTKAASTATAAIVVAWPDGKL